MAGYTLIHTHSHKKFESERFESKWFKVISQQWAFFYIYLPPPKCESRTHSDICVWNYYCNLVYWVYQKMYKFVGMAERNVAVIATVVEVKKHNLST